MANKWCLYTIYIWHIYNIDIILLQCMVNNKTVNNGAGYMVSIWCTHGILCDIAPPYIKHIQII